MDTEVGTHRDSAGALGELDRQVLAFAASQSLVLVSQVQSLLRLDGEAQAASRAGSLVAVGLLREGPRLRHQRGAYQITRRGLDAIDSELPEPRIDLRRYWRELMAGWLWPVAWGEGFGPVERVYSRREVQAADDRLAGRDLTDEASFSPAIRARAVDASFGVRLGTGEAEESERRHYPDVLLVTPQGRIAIELELDPTPPDRLTEILTAYREKQNTRVVLFLVEDPALAGPVRAGAARLGMSRTVHVQRMKLALDSR